MKKTRVQFTIRSVMVAIAFMAVALVAELFFVHTAVEVVKSHDDYVLWEATGVWACLNIFFIGVPARQFGTS